MKLVISVVVLMCVGAAQAQGAITLTLDILSELQKIKTLEERLNTLELQSKNEERVKVAFSASLSASGGWKFIGPYDEARTLVYEHAFINTGNAYDSTTGIFTAPVKGVYFFNFVLFNAAAPATGVKLLKNNKLVLAATDNPPGQDSEDTACNSVTLLLEQGDQILLQLVEKRRIYTDGLNRNTFSGHLLFTDFVVFNANKHPTGMRLLKNSRSVLSATDNAPRHNDEDTTCYSVSLLLEQGDGIHLQLMENHKIYTDIFHRNTFSGHLLFTV